MPLSPFTHTNVAAACTDSASDSCRNKDTMKQHDCSPPTSPFSNLAWDDIHFRDIVPARSPTQPPSIRSSCAFSDIPSDDNTASGVEKAGKAFEDSQYLGQWQPLSHSANMTATVRPGRPQFNRTSISQVSYSAAPSLSHTPASSASFSLPYTPLYTPSTRRLPWRTNPYSSSYGAKSNDLVTPWTLREPEKGTETETETETETATATPPPSPPHYSMKSAPSTKMEDSRAAGVILYAKSPIPSVSLANGSLGRLLSSPS